VLGALLGHIGLTELGKTEVADDQDRDDEGKLYRGDAIGIACEARREGPDQAGRRAHHQKGSLRKAVVTVIRASPDSSRVRAFDSMGVTTGC